MFRTSWDIRLVRRWVRSLTLYAFLQMSVWALSVVLAILASVRAGKQRQRQPRG
jgi:hypothetical protein